MMQVSYLDLYYINESIKSMKQRNIAWIGLSLIGVDSYQFIVYKQLDSSQLSACPNRALVINQKELAAFLKVIPTGTVFNLDVDNLAGIATMSYFDAKLNIQYGTSIDRSVAAHMSKKQELSNLSDMYQCIDVTDRLQRMFKLTMTAGTIQFHYDDNHFLTLFAGILPLLKGDKIFITIMDCSDNTFYTKFRVDKKKTTPVEIYLRYLKTA